MRAANWLERLHNATEAATLRPFDYGAENCGLFAAQCIDAMIDGSTRAAELKTQFTDEASAKAFVAAAGSIEAAVDARLGPGKTDWWHARRGDICLMPTQDGPGLGVCMGEMVAMMAPTGLAHLKIDKALKVWRID